MIKYNPCSKEFQNGFDRFPSVSLIITTYELSEDANNKPIWKAFNGETVERVYQI